MCDKVRTTRPRFDNHGRQTNSVQRRSQNFLSRGKAPTVIPDSAHTRHYSSNRGISPVFFPESSQAVRVRVRIQVPIRTDTSGSLAIDIYTQIFLIFAVGVVYFNHFSETGASRIHSSHERPLLAVLRTRLIISIGIRRGANQRVQQGGGRQGRSTQSAHVSSNLLHAAAHAPRDTSYLNRGPVA